jgi:Ca2+-binding RTX toxin-like protein
MPVLFRRWSVAAVATLLAVVPGPAKADSATCSFDRTAKTVTVNVTGTNDFAPTLIVNPQNQIAISDADPGQSSTCGGTTATTDSILITASGPVNIFYISLTSAFAPGATDETGTSDEIEFTVNFAGGGVLGLLGSGPNPSAASFAIGLGGNQINLDTKESAQLDADVTVSGVTTVLLALGPNSDSVMAQGGFGTPAQPFSSNITVDALQGDDQIHGGAGNDNLFGYQGNDKVFGGAGDDEMQDTTFDAGNDTYDGQDGEDFVSTEGGNDTVLGGAGNDNLRGGDDHDTVLGGDGSRRS